MGLPARFYRVSTRLLVAVLELNSIASSQENEMEAFKIPPSFEELSIVNGRRLPYASDLLLAGRLLRGV